MNVFQLNNPGLWVYFALTVPLFLVITGVIVLLKAGVLYSQSGQKDMGFARWLLAGRPMRSQFDRADLERGNLTTKLKDRLRGPGWHKDSEGPEDPESLGGPDSKHENKLKRAQPGNKKED